MAFIRAAAVASVVAPPQSRDALLQRLAGRDADDRRRAARALSSEPEAAAALAAHLGGELDLAVRDAVFWSLVEIRGDRVARLLGQLLRSPDAGLRSGAIEGLRRLEQDAVPEIDALLADADPDVRLLSIEVTRSWPSAQAGPRLLRLIESDPHVNVCAAAVDVATEVGTPDLIEPLGALRARFADEMFLTFAIDIARDRIHAANNREA